MPGKVVDGNIDNGSNETRHKQERSGAAIRQGKGTSQQTRDDGVMMRAPSLELHIGITRNNSGMEPLRVMARVHENGLTLRLPYF